MDVSLAWQSRTTPEINSTGHVVGKLAWSMTSRCCQEVRCLNPMCLVLHSAKYFNMFFFHPQASTPPTSLWPALPEKVSSPSRAHPMPHLGRAFTDVQECKQVPGSVCKNLFFNAHKGVQALNPQSDIQKLLVGKFNLHISLLCFCARLSGVGIQVVRWQEA